MFLIVGLGNPEKNYSKTRHNMGFDVINTIVNKYQINIEKQKFNGLYSNCIIENNKVIFLKPQTFMNLSGKSIKKFMDFYKLDLENLIVIYDDMDLDVKQIRIRKKGSVGSHNGAKSVAYELQTDNFTRIRVGIGRPNEDEDIIDYVISPIDEIIKKELDIGVEKASEAVIEILKNGIDSAMNKFN